MPIEQRLVDYYKKLLQETEPAQVLEVGSGWGIFTRSCIEYTNAHITTVDKIGGYGLPLFVEHTTGFEDRFERIEEDSHTLLPGKEEAWHERFQFIFVDADHTQNGASKDLTYAWPLLAPGGMLMVDDVFHKENWRCYKHEEAEFSFGVTRAVWGFLQAHHQEFDGDIKIIPEAHGLVVVKKK